MKSLKHLFCIALFPAIVTLSQADEVKMKTGQVYNGRITYEAADIVKIEVPISESIKETKILARGDIETITKDAPDDVEFAKLQKLVPTDSLVQAETYRSMLETGPTAFLKNFPGSKHKPKVEEIRDTLVKELDQVERGFIKINDRWFSPQEKIDFKELIDSELRLARLRSYAKGANLGSYIGAMREFEFIEENYLGTPAFPKALEIVQDFLPTFGGQLQALAARVDYQNAEYERALAASTPDARAQLQAARAREDEALKTSTDTDKKNGVKWTQIDQRNRSAVEAYANLVGSETARLKSYERAQLEKQAEMLVEADNLIAQDKVSEARTKLAEAAAITGQTVPAVDSKSKSKSTKSKGPKATSYAGILNGKISAKLSDEKARSDAAANASASEILAANLKKAEAEKAAAGEGAATEPAEGSAEAGAAAPAADVDEFAALTAGGKPKSEEKEKAKSDPKKEKSKTSEKKKSTSKSKSGDDEDGDDEKPEKKRPVVVDEEEGGGFPGWLIAPILTVLVILAIVVLKVTGIGGKKSE